MAVEDTEVDKAKTAIKALFLEQPRPRQKDVAVATGLSQGYVAKIAKRKFDRVTTGVRKVWEYSRLDPAERRGRLAEESGLARRLSDAGRRLASRDPSLGEAVADFIDRLATR